MYDYSKIFLEMQTNIGLFVFFKKNGELRVMIGTRSIDIARIKYGWISGELSKMDGRCSRSNGNLGLIDLAIGEGRCFNIGRLSYYRNLGTVSSEEEYDKLMAWFNKYNEEYKKNTGLSMNILDDNKGNMDNSYKEPNREINMEEMFNGELSI